ncbi:MAG: FmdB family zinc ribbon protein [Thermoguttaceae bacterium]
MPTYEYHCDGCSHQFEEFQSIKADPLKKCPECGKMKLRRLISGGAAIVFKGTGFYQTDYRSESYKKGAAASKTVAEAPKSEATKTETKKSDVAKSDAKPTTKSTKKA